MRRQPLWSIADGYAGNKCNNPSLCWSVGFQEGVICGYAMISMIRRRVMASTITIFASG